VAIVFRTLLIALMICLPIGPAGAQSEVPQAQELIALLKEEKYEMLDAHLTRYQNAFEADFRQEKNVQVAFLSFQRTDPSLERYLSEWIIRFPKSYSGRLARGLYYGAVGINKRGSRVASKTTATQVSGMQLYFSKAQEDLRAALEMNPQLMPAYTFMIFIPMVFGLRDQTKAIIDEALRKNPYSFSARWSYLASLEPRWGGSYREMEDFIAQARPYYGKYPYLIVLNGKIFAARGDEATNWGTTLFHYDKALAYGEHWHYYLGRGKSLYHLQRYGEAVVALDRALQLWPGFGDALKLRGLAHWGVGNYEKSLKDLTAVIDMDPTHHELINARGELHFAFERYRDALKDYEEALRLSPDNQAYVGNRDKALRNIPQGQR